MEQNRRPAPLPASGLAVLTLLASFGTLAPATFAMEHPDAAVGFAAGGLQSLAVDHVSTYNGGLTVSVPVGPLFQLIYNSHVWTTTQRDLIYTEALLNRRNNAGVGWRASLGKLYAPDSWYGNESPSWVWVGPDGSSHNFFQDAHWGEADGDDEVWYTRDGSNLRIKRLSGSNGRIIEFPDGSRHTFLEVPGWYNNFVLRKIEDRFGNVTTIDYSYTDNNWLQSQTWTITDPEGRVHYVHLEPTWNALHQISSIDYETVGGQRAVYQFTYQTVHRWRSKRDNYPYNNDLILVNFLTKVTYPDGSELRMMNSDGTPRYYDLIGNLYDLPGVMAGLELPTGGQLEWDFTAYTFMNADDPNSPTQGTGVAERRMIRADGTLESTVTYKQTWTALETWPAVATQTDIVYPGGHCTRNFFWQQPWLGLIGWLGWDHGLGYQKNISDGERYLSSEVWNSSSADSCAGTKLRSTWVSYEHDQLPNSTHYTVADQWMASNIRLKNQRVVYHDDGDRFLDTLYEDWDGVGHHRKTTVTGNLKSLTVDDVRTNTTDFNPVRRTYEIDQATNLPTANHDYVRITTTDEWLLGLYDWTEVSEPGAYQLTKLRQEFDFDPATGFLRGTRTLASASQRGTHDILQIFTPTTKGQVASTALYGGDLQTLDTGPGWTTPATWTYKVENTYQYGVLKTSRAVKPDGTYMPFYTTDLDLDPSTGQTLVSRDPSGLATSYSYDLLGRVTEVAPQEGAITRSTYTNAGAGTPARVTTIQYAANGTTPLTYRETRFDDFGRTWLERRMVPDHGWVDKETLYNVSGAVDSVSAWGDLTKVTRYMNHDAFGRPTLVRPPEGATHDVLLTYWGDRVVRTGSQVATSTTAESTAYRYVYSDSFGRTRLVTDAYLVNGAHQYTSYLYNAGNKLRRIHAKAADTGVVQQRYFTYDGRGFLLSERNPEKGPTGNNWTYYYDYDASGKPGRILDGPNDLGFQYDEMGRVTRVEDRSQGNRALKEITYDGGWGRGEGKPYVVTRHNYVTLPGSGGETDHSVQVRYAYTGTGGRPSHQLTMFNGAGLAARTIYTYSDLGQVATVKYPACEAGWNCPQTPEPSRTVTYNYEDGFLRQVPGWTNTLTYHPSGAWDQMPRVNTVTDGRDRDPASPDRLNRFYASGPSASWNSGPLQYDGSGNLKAIGSETYVYDNASRLVSGTASGQSQDYTYDAFSNLTQIDHTQGGSTTTRTIAVVPSTNRLSVGVYDSAGNMTSWGGNTYSWDPLGSMTHFNNGAWTYLYDPQDRRVAIIKDVDGTAANREETYLARGLSGEALREFRSLGDNLPANRSWSKDYIYASGNLLASVRADGETRHYHRDHLGTPRLITNAAGGQVGGHTYLPYGEEVTDPAQNDEVMKYTLHQRDKNFSGTDDDLDYMLARYYSPHLGRFLSCDPNRGNAERLQTLNRYAYAWGNPVRYVDPDGRDPEGRGNPLDDADEEDGGLVTFYEQIWAWGLGGVGISIDPSGLLSFLENLFNNSGGGGGSGNGGDGGGPSLPNDKCDEMSWLPHCELQEDPCAWGGTTGSAAEGWKHVTSAPGAQDVLDQAVELLQSSFANGFAEHGRYAYGTDQLNWSRVFTDGDPRGVVMPVAGEHKGSLRFGIHTHPGGTYTSTVGIMGDSGWAARNKVPYFSFSPTGVAMVMPDGSQASAAWAYFGRGFGGRVKPGQQPCKT